MIKSKDKQLGLYWGVDKLHFIESISTSPVKLFNLKISDQASQGGMVDGKYIPAGMSGEIQLAPLISNALEHQQVSSSLVNVSLPIKDIIFRTFVIPWMQQNEVKNVVEFEASKYVPFSLDELYYSYHPMTITISGSKRIRIIFVAIKKDSLEKYTNTLQAAKLTINIVEPAPLSMVRALTLKNLLPQDKIIAIIQKEETSGKIYVVEKGIPLFVREFQLRIPSGQKDTGPKALMVLLMNEIRISLDYFNRQNNQIQAKEALVLATANEESIAQNIEENIKIPAKAIPLNTVIGTKETKDLDLINAYGASLLIPSGPESIFDLAGEELKSKGRLQSIRNKISLNSTIKTVFVCIPILIAAFVLPGRLMTSTKNTLAQLESQIGRQGFLTLEDIKKQNDTLSQKVNYFKNLRFKSNIFYFMATLPKHITKGTWISNITIDYSRYDREVDALNFANLSKTPAQEISISGYSHWEDKNTQFKNINNFNKNLKEDKEIKEAFDSIEIESVNSQNIGQYSATAYKIIMK